MNMVLADIDKKTVERISEITKQLGITRTAFIILCVENYCQNFIRDNPVLFSQFIYRD